jgi:anti-repressor protein
MNALMTVGATLRMTSREISELTGLRHDNVLRTARDLAARGVTQSEETHEINTQNRQSYPVHSLDKRDSLVLVARLSPEFTGRIVDRWLELEGQATPAAIDFNNPALLRGLLLNYTERVDTLQAAIAHAAPKVEFADAVSNTTGLTKIAPFAKTIGWGPNKFFTQLRTDEILMENNLPFQAFINRGYFKVVEKAPYRDNHGGEHPTFTTMITGRGQQWLTNRYAPALRSA